MISVFVGGGGGTFGIGAEALLPVEDREPRIQKSRVLTLLWALYRESPDEFDEDSAALVRGLQRLVRGAVRAEVAVPGPHRSEREILYDVAHGGALERMLDDPAVDFEAGVPPRAREGRWKLRSSMTATDSAPMLLGWRRQIRRGSRDKNHDGEHAVRKADHMILFLELAGLALSTAAHVVRAVRRS